ncbi:Hypothetical protein CINCED_3A003430 [Cinara cedri]|uniref:Uncharacterized protein n=1 Tax=Cinara cedri TaxID=506608 RepID=A0A5E4NQ94_9HEMI|nr:Hypothetical protein CINCED_3A003430 [Cinara cedri]
MANISPSTKNPMGKPVSSAQRMMIVNSYKVKLKKNTKLTVREAHIFISKQLGTGHHRCTGDYRRPMTERIDPARGVRMSLCNSFGCANTRIETSQKEIDDFPKYYVYYGNQLPKGSYCPYIFHSIYMLWIVGLLYHDMMNILPTSNISILQKKPLE